MAAFEYSSVNEVTSAVALLRVTSTVLEGSATQSPLRFQGETIVPAPAIAGVVVFCRIMLPVVNPETPRASEYPVVVLARPKS